MRFWGEELDKTAIPTEVHERQRLAALVASEDRAEWEARHARADLGEKGRREKRLAEMARAFSLSGERAVRRILAENANARGIAGNIDPRLFKHPSPPRLRRAKGKGTRED